MDARSPSHLLPNLPQGVLLQPGDLGLRDADFGGHIVLRLYEAKKAAAKAEVSLQFGAAKAYLCDMLENVIEEVPVTDGKIVLPFRAFEIKTVRVKR